MTRVSSATRRLLVLLLLPAVWLGMTPEVAQAASSSDVLQFQMERVGEDVHCQIPITYGEITTDGVLKVGSGYCEGYALGDGVPGTCDALDAECTVFTLEVVGCSTVQLSDSAAATTFMRTLTYLGATSIALGECNPPEICLSFKTTNFGRDAEGRDCETVDFSDAIGEEEPEFEPPVEMPWGDCKHGYPFGLYIRHVTTWESTLNPPTTMYKDKWRVGFENRPMPPLQDGAEWTLRAAHNPEGSIAPTIHPTTTDGTSPPSSNPQWINKDLWVNDPVALTGSHNKTDGEVWGVQITTKDPSLTAANIPIGYTNPGKCTFWFGPKIRNGEHPTYGDDDPWEDIIHGEPVAPQPVPDPTPVVPTPIDDPSVDAGWLDAIARIIDSLLTAIADIVKELAKLLKDLLIPDPASWGFFELVDQFQAKPPFSIIDVTYGETRHLVDEFKGSAGCSILPSINIPGSDSRFTCVRLQEGGMGSLYNIVQWGMVTLTGLALFKMVSGYFSKDGG